MLYLDLFCASFSKMCPQVTASLLYVILAYKRFHRNTLLSERGETCTYVEIKPTSIGRSDYSQTYFQILLSNPFLTENRLFFRKQSYLNRLCPGSMGLSHLVSFWFLKIKKNVTFRASLVVQWLRICLPMQETRV